MSTSRGAERRGCKQRRCRFRSCCCCRGRCRGWRAGHRRRDAWPDLPVSFASASAAPATVAFTAAAAANVVGMKAAVASAPPATTTDPVTPVLDMRPHMKNLVARFIVLESRGAPPRCCRRLLLACRLTHAPAPAAGDVTRTRDGNALYTYVVADETGSINWSLWGDAVGRLVRVGDVIQITGGHAAAGRCACRPCAAGAADERRPAGRGAGGRAQLLLAVPRQLDALLRPLRARGPHRRVRCRRAGLAPRAVALADGDWARRFTLAYAEAPAMSQFAWCADPTNARKLVREIRRPRAPIKRPTDHRPSPRPARDPVSRPAGTCTGGRPA